MPSPVWNETPRYADIANLSADLSISAALFYDADTETSSLYFKRQNDDGSWPVDADATFVMEPERPIPIALSVNFYRAYDIVDGKDILKTSVDGGKTWSDPEEGETP